MSVYMNNEYDVDIEEDYSEQFKMLKLISLDFFDFENVKLTLDTYYPGIIGNIKEETIAFGANISGKPFIIINKDNFLDFFNDDEKKIILAHEAAHAVACIYDEEEADMWAMDILNEKQKSILIDMWTERHGHSYNNKMKEK